MIYTFTGKDVKVGDICLAMCLKEHVKAMHLNELFEKEYNSWTSVCKIGIKVVWTSKTRCKGYLVFTRSGKIFPYKNNNNLIYTTFTTGNNVGLIKHIK